MEGYREEQVETGVPVSDTFETRRAEREILKVSADNNVEVLQCEKSLETTRLRVNETDLYEMTGETYEVIRRIAGEYGSINHNIEEPQLISQSAVSTVNYEFSTFVNGKLVRFLLDAYQAIVVDNGKHVPYLLLNPSAVAKMNSVLKADDGRPLAQETQVILTNEANSNYILSGDVAINNFRQGHNIVVVDEDDLEKNGNRDEVEEVRPNAVDANVLANINAAINAAILENEHFNHANANATDANIDAEPAARPARVVFTDLLRRLWYAGRRVLSFLAKVLFVMRVLGIGVPGIILKNWMKVLIWVFLLSNMFVLFFSGDRVATRAVQGNDGEEVPRGWSERVRSTAAGIIQNMRTTTNRVVNSIRDDLIHTVLRRGRDYDLILGESNNFYFNFENIWKDLLLGALVIFPSVQFQIEVILAETRPNEVDELTQKVKNMVELVDTLAVSYSERFVPVIVNSITKEDIDGALEAVVNMAVNEPENEALNEVQELEELEELEQEQVEEEQEIEARISSIEIYERQFNMLIDYYKRLHEVYVKLNWAFVKNSPLEGGRRRGELAVPANEVHVEDEDEIEELQRYQDQFATGANVNLE